MRVPRLRRLDCSNLHLECQGDVLARVVAVRRTNVGYRTVDDLDASFDGLHRWLAAIDRVEWKLLIDARDAPARMAASFEPAFERHRIAITSGFRRIAVLVRSSVGRFEVERRSRNATSAHEPFSDETQALQYLMDDAPL